MAELRRVGDEVEVRLSTLEKIAGMRRDFRVPVSAVTDVAVIDQPMAAVTGVRAPGAHVPGRVKIGTWRGRDGKTFASARAGVPAVRVDLVGQPFRQLVISVPDAKTVADRIR
ncbi:Uncharacterised protein [Mycolicibacterium aurum]|uniref:Uncharacterized protein n=1 Tax=Mycolicibacterium aurum TaxID=1791 RepID=A0A448IPN7_MYCAU|nr:hypothetical protein [Mycolicibacterium aurum]VEG54347.1 Uncharacterised protein [Mycolicibacterium aurum]